MDGYVADSLEKRLVVTQALTGLLESYPRHFFLFFSSFSALTASALPARGVVQLCCILLRQGVPPVVVPCLLRPRRPSSGAGTKTGEFSVRETNRKLQVFLPSERAVHVESQFS